MMRKKNFLSFLLSVVLIITSCTLNTQKDFTDWEVVVLEGVGCFRLPLGWSMEQTGDFLTGYDENGNAVMLEITEESVYGDYEPIDEYEEFFSNSSAYGKYRYLINEQEVELFMVDFSFYTEENDFSESLVFVFLNPDIDEEIVRKIAMSYEMQGMS